MSRRKASGCLKSVEKKAAGENWITPESDCLGKMARWGNLVGETLVPVGPGQVRRTGSSASRESRGPLGQQWGLARSFAGSGRFRSGPRVPVSRTRGRPGKQGGPPPPPPRSAWQGARAARTRRRPDGPGPSPVPNRTEQNRTGAGPEPAPAPSQRGTERDATEREPEPTAGGSGPHRTDPRRPAPGTCSRCGRSWRTGRPVDRCRAPRRTGADRRARPRPRPGRGGPVRGRP